MGFEIKGPSLGQAGACLLILRALPDWFGIEAALSNYEKEIDRLPTFLACRAGAVLGFLSLKEHNPYSAEIYVMGVKLEAQRMGIGKALVGNAEAHARRQGVEYLQVKTLGPSRPDESYARTRAFYQAMGFRPLEEFERIWNEQNPCLVMIKRL